ncbi:MAG: hypothetical protein V1746_03580, partial [bacterium]
MFAVKDFWKFQDASEDDIEAKYQTSAQHRNFQKDSQPEGLRRRERLASLGRGRIFKLNIIPRRA